MILSVVAVVLSFHGSSWTVACADEQSTPRSCSDELHEFVVSHFRHLLANERGGLRIGYGFTYPPHHKLLQVGFQGAASEEECRALIDYTQTLLQATLVYWEQVCLPNSSDLAQERIRINCSGRGPHRQDVLRRFILRQFLLEDEPTVQEELLTHAQIDAERERGERITREIIRDVLKRAME